MVKVIFLEVRSFEKEYISQNTPSNIEYEMYPDTINEINKDKFKNVEIISVFTDSSVTSEVLKGLPDLKMVNTRSTGIDHIDLDYCKKYNITVTNVPAYGQEPVAEYAFALILNLVRKVTLANNDLKMDDIHTAEYLGYNLKGKTIGIIGTGSIGSNVARLANAYNMKIIAFDPYPKTELANKYNLKYVSLDDLFINSDIVTIHAPYVGKNYHMVNEELLSKMKKDAYLINTARGELVDTDALLQVLKSKIIAGAALDVLESEKILKKEGEFALNPDRINKKDLINTLQNHELLNMRNVIITPHNAYETKEAVNQILEATMDDIRGYLDHNIINKAA